MQVVADTSTVVSGLMWSGAPRQVLDVARTGRIRLFTSVALLAELDDVLRRDKFVRQLARAGTKPRRLLAQYAALAHVVEPETIVPVVLADADDDAVLAGALAAHADVIVTGDRHLLQLNSYRNITIVPANELLRRLSP